MAEIPPTDADLHRLPTDEDLNRLQLTTLLYYLHETNPDNWLVRDKTDPAAPVFLAKKHAQRLRVRLRVNYGD